jgi:hypothetical protein
MNMMQTWKEKRNRIYILVKKISNAYGGDDVEWLREYCREVVETNKHDLDKALNCFLDIEKQLKYKQRST